VGGRDRNGVVEAIIEIAPGLHTAGTFSRTLLYTIFEHASRREIRHSVETGCGASTLLLSHLSEDHTVFAMDAGSGSIANVRRSPLLRQDKVAFVEGPTPKKLPLYRFENELQFALLDGPHAYPFPDLEYFYIYPHLAAGALLVVDDIHIRSVHNLYEFLRRDAMFRLDEVAGTTAFFTRTAAPVFEPFADGWWEQRYNRRTLLRYSWKERARHSIPPSIRRHLSRVKRRANLPKTACAVEITSPAEGAEVGQAGGVEGSTALGDGAYLWILVHRTGFEGWWPQGGGPIAVEGSRWRASVRYGEPRDIGYDFEIAALIVGQPTHDLWTDWVARAASGVPVAPVLLPAAQFVLAEAYTRVRKRT
jgi:hypothetical protein